MNEIVAWAVIGFGIGMAVYYILYKIADWWCDR